MPGVGSIFLGKSDPLHAPLQNYRSSPIFTASEGGAGSGNCGCAVEVRDRPELFKVVVRIDTGFETTGLEPWTYLLRPGTVDLCGFFGVKTVALQGLLTLPQQRLHYSPRLLPIPPTYKLNGSSLGRPDVDLIPNVCQVGFQHSMVYMR